MRIRKKIANILRVPDRFPFPFFIFLSLSVLVIMTYFLTKKDSSAFRKKINAKRKKKRKRFCA